jgi:putative addiction module antidote
MYNMGDFAMTAHEKIDPASPAIATVQLKKIGNSTGLILSKELLARLNLSTGDEFCVTLTPGGGLQLTPYDPKFEKAMEVARRGMKIYRNALAELAK